MKKKTLIIPYLKIKKYKDFFENKNIVLVGGCFDLLHYGHLKFLQRAKKIGDFLIVALESDEFIIKNKKRIPIHNQKQRAEILSHIDFVDIVILLPFFSSDNDYFEMVKKIKPKIIAVTSGDPQLKNKKKQAEAIGAKVRVVTSLFSNFSTTKIINKLKKNMRLFLAIDLPDEIKIKIDKKIQSLKKEYPHFRWVPWENFHVTIYFFLEKKIIYKKSKKKIEKIIWNQSLFYLYSLNIDIFSNNKLVIYLNFRREKKIEKLAEIVKSTFENFKKDKNRKKFIPHLTLARGTRSSKQQYFALKKKLSKIKIDVSFLVDKIILFESKLNKERPVYKKLAFFKLQDTE